MISSRNWCLSNHQLFELPSVAAADVFVFFYYFLYYTCSLPLAAKKYHSWKSICTKHNSKKFFPDLTEFQTKFVFLVQCYWSVHCEPLIRKQTHCGISIALVDIFRCSSSRHGSCAKYQVKNEVFKEIRKRDCCKKWFVKNLLHKVAPFWK